MHVARYRTAQVGVTAVAAATIQFITQSLPDLTLQPDLDYQIVGGSLRAIAQDASAKLSILSWRFLYQLVAADGTVPFQADLSLPQPFGAVTFPALNSSAFAQAIQMHSSHFGVRDFGPAPSTTLRILGQITIQNTDGAAPHSVQMTTNATVESLAP